MDLTALRTGLWVARKVTHKGVIEFQGLQSKRLLYSWLGKRESTARHCQIMALGSKQPEETLIEPV